MAPADFLGGVNRLLHRHSGPAAETRPSAAARLPEWCSKGARLQYISKSRGDVHIVEVEKIEDKPQAVLIRFEQDRRTWKRVPFSEVTVICDGTLRPMWKKTAGDAAATVPEKPDGFVLEEVPDSEDEANMAQPVDPAEPFEGPDPAQSDEEAQAAGPERPPGARGAGLEAQAEAEAAPPAACSADGTEEPAAPDLQEAAAGGARSPAAAPAAPAEAAAEEAPPAAPASPEEEAAEESPPVAPVSPEEEAADSLPAAPASPEGVPEDPPLMPVEEPARARRAAAAGRPAVVAMQSPCAAAEPDELGVPEPGAAAASGAAGEAAVAAPPGAAEAPSAPAPAPAAPARVTKVPRRLRQALKQAASAPAPPPPDVEGPILLDDLPPEPTHEEAAIVDPYFDISLKVGPPAEVTEQISSANSRAVFLEDSSEAPRKARRCSWWTSAGHMRDMGKCDTSAVFEFTRRRSTSGRAVGRARGMRPAEPPPTEPAPPAPGRLLPEVPASLLVLPEVVASPRKSRSAATAAMSKVLKAPKAGRAATEAALRDEGLEVVRATLTFEPVNPHEVRIEQGDRVQILEHHASGWTYCRNLATTAGAATTGWAPSWIVPEEPRRGKKRRKKPRLDT